MITAEWAEFRGKVAGFEQAIWEWSRTSARSRFIHSSLGHELAAFLLRRHLAVDAARWCLYYRSHAWALALGCSLEAVTNEITGANKAGTSSMHLLLRPEIIDCNSIVAAQFPIAVGAALANRDTPVVCVAGDGATNTGAFFESLNVAARHSLPVLFVIEDNGVQITTPYQSTSNSSVREKGAAFRVPVAAIDEFDLEQADMVVKQSVLNLERGPALLHVNVKRCGAHMMSGVSEFEAPPVIWEDRAARYAYEAYVMETRKLCLRSEVKIDG